MKNLKRNAVVVVVLLFVCAAVYLNWSYNNKWGDLDNSMSEYEDNAAKKADAEFENTILDKGESEPVDVPQDPVNEYFASARLTRQQSRDEALGLLQQAATAETASQEIIDSAMNSINAMATYSMQESQIENLLIAKDFVDCVVFLNDEAATIAVPAPLDGLTEAAVARITDVVTSETSLDATQIRIIEIKED